MAKPSFYLVETLRDTAQRLEKGAYYQWAHQGSCNCGHLAQTITKLSKAEIHRLALEKEGNWEDKTIEYCKTSGYTIDHIITSMIDMGLTTDDIANLEKLSCPNILKYVPADKKPLIHNNKEDVILYMRAWANLLEDQLMTEANKMKFSLTLKI
ncbi:MAG: hypothetical protein H7263_10325 [Candidatus Sericytochromatia bacterium]|nr:hypothetical protein [Candidatus Sericytochromatia bacterium]